MGNLFNLDTPIMQKLQKASQVFFCGICFILSCIPVITIGAAVTAMHRMMFNLREEKPTGVSAYFKAFVKELPKSTVLWIMDLFCAGAAAGLFYLILLIDPRGAVLFLLLAVFFIAVFLWALTFSYVFPLEAFFENTIGNTLRNGLFMSVKHRKKSIPVLFLSVIPVLGYMISEYYFLILLPAWLFLVLPAIFYLQSGLLLSVFEEYIPEDVPGKNGDEAESEGSL